MRHLFDDEPMPEPAPPETLPADVVVVPDPDYGDPWTMSGRIWKSEEPGRWIFLSHPPESDDPIDDLGPEPSA